MKPEKTELHININFFQDELTKTKRQKTIKHFKGDRIFKISLNCMTQGYIPLKIDILRFWKNYWKYFANFGIIV